MKKSPNAGLSGAVRVQQLKLSDLTMAEKHGKRLDATSRARRISRDAPLTTTGLDLRKLHRHHLDKVYVPKAKSKAMHVIIQFPKDLVDGEAAALMLRHARAFVEDVFGPDSIFADRVDRDERGQHIVDVFVAPKYTKITKHQQKTAVTMSRHLKNEKGKLKLIAWLARTWNFRRLNFSCRRQTRTVKPSQNESVRRSFPSNWCRRNRSYQATRRRLRMR